MAARPREAQPAGAMASSRRSVLVALDLSTHDTPELPTHPKYRRAASSLAFDTSA